nr:uncharacterized protein LOC133622516 isoform X2 [Nerophis lumbriciformis]
MASCFPDKKGLIFAMRRGDIPAAKGWCVRRSLLWEMKEQFLVEADRRMVTELVRMATKMVQRASMCGLKDCCQRAINACLDDAVRRGLIRDAAILLLPSIFREDSSLLYTLLEEPSVPTPAIMLHNTHEGNPLQAQRITLYLDGIQVLTEDSSMDISYAMSALMSLYFVFAVQYPKELRKTLIFIERHILDQYILFDFGIVTSLDFRYCYNT